jgi:hypothetical protein
VSSFRVATPLSRSADDVADLDSLDDLSDRPESESILAAFRAQLPSWMTDVDDPLREQFSRIAGS